MIYVPNMAVTVSIAAANEQIIGAALLNNRYPVSKPLPYNEHSTVSAMNGPPAGIAPRANESAKETPAIQRISENAIFKLEYERSMIINAIAVTTAAPLRENIENTV